MGISRAAVSSRDDPAVAQLEGCGRAFWSRLEEALAAIGKFREKCEDMRSQLDRDMAAVANARGLEGTRRRRTRQG